MMFDVCNLLGMHLDVSNTVLQKFVGICSLQKCVCKTAKWYTLDFYISVFFLVFTGAKESNPAHPWLLATHTLQLATGYTCAVRQFLSSYRSTSCRWWSRYGYRRRAVASGAFRRAAGSVDTGVRDTGGRRSTKHSSSRAGAASCPGVRRTRQPP